MVFEWIALIVAFGIFFGTIINKYIENCNSCDKKSKYNQYVPIN